MLPLHHCAVPESLATSDWRAALDAVIADYVKTYGLTPQHILLTPALFKAYAADPTVSALGQPIETAFRYKDVAVSYNPPTGVRIV